MSCAALVPASVFGVRSDVSDNLCFLDEQHVVYPAGANIVILNIDQKTQRFIPAGEGGGKFTAMAVSPNRRFIAIAEKSDRPSVNIYDLQTLKKRKVYPCLFGVLKCRRSLLARKTVRSKNLLQWRLPQTPSIL